MALFGVRRFLDEDDEDWQVETWKWMLAEYGGHERLRESQFVLPTRDFFPLGPDGDRARAKHIFSCVQRSAGMEDWPCRLIVQPPRADLRVSDVAYLKPVDSPPCGTFVVNDGVAEISYEPGLVSDPIGLVATFAHELAHYRMTRAETMPPGGVELVEFATDMTTVFFGFGLFGANNAFNFGQSHHSGWQWSRAGYLSQRAWVFALAAFMKLRDQAIDDAQPHLKGYLYSDLRTAWRCLDGKKSPLDNLRAH